MITLNVKAIFYACAAIAAADLGMVGACASCQTPTAIVGDASTPPPAPVVAADSPLPAIATPTCKAACGTMGVYHCGLADAGDCANTMTRIDMNPGATVGPNGRSPTCACIADAGSLAAIQACGVVCPP